MLDKALGAVEKYNMLSPGAAVIAAVSGGADSMAMLLFLMKIRERYSLSLTVAHVNHGLRGEEARRDENYVRSFCEKNGLRFEVLHADVAALAKQRGESCEECGRRVRYEFFESIDKNAKIATAHTASDNAETMLFNLARGSSLKGLCGIPPVRGSIIRPLIFCTREEIEEFCRENSLDFVTDSTNLTLDYSRNKIRRIAVPALKEINSAFEENASHFSQNAALDEDFLEGETKALLLSAQADGGLSCEALLSAHPAIRRRALLGCIKNVCPKSADFKTVGAVENILSPGGKIQLSPDTFAVSDGAVLRFAAPIKKGEEWSEDIEPECINGSACHNGRVSICRVNKKNFLDTQKIHKDVLDYCIDCDKIIGRVRIGSRCSGDKLTLARRGCTKSLKKLLNEAHIPPESRCDIAVLRDEAGVLWVEGFGADRRCRVGKNTENVLIIRREKQ